MQKNKQLHTIIFMGLDQEHLQPIADELQKLRTNTRILSIANTGDFEKALSDINTGLVVYSHKADANITTLGTIISSSNKDIPIVTAYPETDFEQQLTDSKNASVFSHIIETQPALAAHTLQRELKHSENRRRRRQAEFFLQELEQRCRKLLSDSSSAVAYLNKEGQFIFLNQSFADMLHYSDSSALLGKSLESMVSSTYQEQFNTLLSSALSKGSDETSADLPLNSKHNSELPFHLLLQQTRFERSQCIEVKLSAASGQIAPQKPSDDDHLTGLKNQLYLLKQLEQEITQCTASGSTSYLIYIKPELYDTKESEDDFGVADSVMQHNASTLKTIINRAHTLVRYQENAFCVLFSNPDREKAKILAEQIHQSLTTKPANINGKSFDLIASIGIVAIGADSFEPNMVVSLAMTTASETDNGVSFYGIEETVEDSVTSEELQNAVAKGQLKLLFQPIVSLCAEQKSYYEVLLRMLDENNNQVSPNEFINMLNHDDISLELDRWVISESIQQLAKNQAQNQTNSLFISLTGRTIDDTQFVPWLAQQLNNSGVNAENLIFQFSENDISERLNNCKNLANSLAKLKAQLCIKHYGSSISSDLILEQIDANLIKLDGMFIKELADSSKHETFERLIEPVKKQRKTLIAPLVEDTSVISKLFMSGVGYIQGYYLQAPREQMDYDFFGH